MQLCVALITSKNKSAKRRNKPRHIADRLAPAIGAFLLPSVTIAAEALRLSCPAYKGAMIGGDKADSGKAKAPSPCHNAEAIQAEAIAADR